MRCLACGHSASPGAKFCIACGKSVAPSCLRCGAVQPQGALFCPGCGARIAAAGGDSVSPLSESSTHAAGPVEKPDLGAFVERVRRSERRHSVEAKMRPRRVWLRRVGLVVGVVTAFTVGGAAWLVLSEWRPSQPVRVAEAPTPAPIEAAIPARPERTPGPDGNDAAESTPTPEVNSVEAPSGQPQRSELAPEVASQPRPSDSPRDEAARPRARFLPPPEPKLPPSQRLQPESGVVLPLFGLVDPGNREVRVEVRSGPARDAGYTVRLSERDGRPVTDAIVSIRGHRSDGTLVEAPLGRTTEPGLYRAAGWLTEGLTDARLRIASAGRLQEVPLPDAPR